MEGLICPKCHGEMRSYERSGVTVDQCSDCRGIFLDRGEIERLVDAENSYHGSSPREKEYREPRREEYREPRREEYHGGHGQYGHKKRKRSFLDELFD